MTTEEVRAAGLRFWEAIFRWEHTDGIEWHQAPLPRRWHRCKPWSSGCLGARCACGAARFEGRWCDRNSRRR